jgi:hypothetical protein
MRFSARALFAVVFVVVVAPFLCGQHADGPNAPCPYQFTAGKTNSNTYIQYCVTDNGNLSSIETPFGHPMLAPDGEGYGLCQESPAVEYHDYIGSSSGWNPAQVLSLTGSSIKISRTTSDGRWTLVQAISKVSANGSIKIVMALTNNARSDQVAYLLRFADISPDGIRSNPAGASLESAWALDQETVGADGLQLQNLGKSPFSYQHAFVYEYSVPPNACDFAFNSIVGGLIDPTKGSGKDPSVSYVYVGGVRSQQTITVTLSYHAL